jgi:hypothetical protein
VAGSVGVVGDGDEKNGAVLQRELLVGRGESGGWLTERLDVRLSAEGDECGLSGTGGE